MWFKKKEGRKDIELEEFKQDLSQFLMERGCINTETALKMTEEFTKKYRNKLFEVC